MWKTNGAGLTHWRGPTIEGRNENLKHSFPRNGKEVGFEALSSIQDTTKNNNELSAKVWTFPVLIRIHTDQGLKIAAMLVQRLSAPACVSFNFTLSHPGLMQNTSMCVCVATCVGYLINMSTHTQRKIFWYTLQGKTKPEARALRAPRGPSKESASHHLKYLILRGSVKKYPRIAPCRPEDSPESGKF